MSVLSEEEINTICRPCDGITKDFILSQTMYRIKEPRRTLKFYSQVLGMTLLLSKDFPEWKFSLFYMGYENPAEVPKEFEERKQWTLTRRGALEFTHNWGTEDDPNFNYKTGNCDQQGYGHVGLTVPNIEEACAHFDKHGVEFVKRPSEGRMRGLAFIKDPDGYCIEVLCPSCG